MFEELPGSEIIDGYYVVPGSPEWYRMWNAREWRRAKMFVEGHGGAYAVFFSNGIYGKRPIAVLVESYEELRRLKWWPDALLPPDEKALEKVRPWVEAYREPLKPKEEIKAGELHAIVEGLLNAIEEVGGIVLRFE